MILKLAVWLSYSLAITCVFLVVVLAALNSPQGSILCAVLAILFAFIGGVEARELEAWKNDNEWRDAYRNRF